VTKQVLLFVVITAGLLETQVSDSVAAEALDDAWLSITYTTTDTLIGWPVRGAVLTNSLWVL